MKPENRPQNLAQLPALTPQPHERLPAVIQSKSQIFSFRVSRKQLFSALALGVAFTLGALLARFDREAPRGVGRIPASTDSSAKAGAPLGRAELNARISRAILQTLSQKVVYADVLGEGQGGWDDRPRFPDKEVNCILWIQEVLALAYAPDNPYPAMDSLRYFRGIPAFGMRKHFNAHWMSLEAAPLQAIAPQVCEGWKTEKVAMDFELFRKSNHYNCPLFGAEHSEASYEMIGASSLTECAHRLDPGYYILFGVASDRYQQKYGRKTGPMGLVHGILLEISLAGQSFVYHASTQSGGIQKERLNHYVQRMQKDLHRGYTLYSLDPAWQPVDDLEYTPEIQEILACESKLPAPRPKTTSF